MSGFRGGAELFGGGVVVQVVINDVAGVSGVLGHAGFYPGHEAFFIMAGRAKDNLLVTVLDIGY